MFQGQGFGHCQANCSNRCVMNIKEIKDITQAMEAKTEKVEDALKSRSLTFIFIEAKLS